MTMIKMTISAVLPAYNCEKFIVRAIESVLGQTSPPHEIIVIDDGSTDDTADIVRSFGDKVILLQQENAGPSAARNAGIKAATGQWIAFLDADDQWLPEHLQHQVAVVTKEPVLVWSTANYVTCSCSEKRQAPYLRPQDIKRVLGEKQFLNDYLDACRQGISGHTVTMFIQRNVLLEAGLFKEGLHVGEDLDMWWRIAYLYPQIGYEPQPSAIHHLGIPKSLMKKMKPWQQHADLIQEHLETARQKQRLDVFQRLATHLLRGWMRAMLFHAQGEGIRQLLRQFHELLPRWYRYWMWLLTICPRLTQAGCLLISKVIRTLNLRRRVVMPPGAIEE